MRGACSSILMDELAGVIVGRESSFRQREESAQVWSGIVAASGTVAAPTNLPAILMRLFWKKTTSTAPVPFSNPGIISVPLSFIVLVVVSLMTQKKGEEVDEAEVA